MSWIWSGIMGSGFYILPFFVKSKCFNIRINLALKIFEKAGIPRISQYLYSKFYLVLNYLKRFLYSNFFFRWLKGFWVFWIRYFYLRSSAWKCCSCNNCCCCRCRCHCCCRCCFGSWHWRRNCGSFNNTLLMIMSLLLMFKYLSVPRMKYLKTELRSTFYWIFRTEQYQKSHNTSLFKSSHGLTLLNGCTWMNQKLEYNQQ